MLNKFLLFVFACLMLGHFQLSHALLDKPANITASTTTIYQNLHVVSANDFGDIVQVEILGATANTAYDIYADRADDDKYFIKVTTATANAQGLINLSVPLLWQRWSPNSLPSSDYRIDFIAKQSNDSNIQTGSAIYKANVSYIQTIVSNNKGYSQNATIPAGTAVTFTCQNASEMYSDLKSKYPGQAQKVSSLYSSANNQSADYTLSHSLVATPGVYQIECDNIGGSLTRSVFIYTVPCPTAQSWDDNSNSCQANSTMSGTLSASPISCTIPAGGSGCGSVLSWGDLYFDFCEASGPVMASPLFPSLRGTKQSHSRKLNAKCKMFSENHTISLSLSSLWRRGMRKVKNCL